MTDNSDYKNELTAVLITCTLFLWIKFFITTEILALKSSKVGNRTKEDFGSIFKYDEKLVKESDKESEIRWWFIELNDLENLPWALLIFWGASTVVANPISRFRLIVSVVLYSITRLFHTISFSLGNFRLRALSHGVGLLCIVYSGLSATLSSWSRVN
jgi:hypothetical protein